MTTTRLEGDLTGRGLHIGIVVTIWNQTITNRLLHGAERRCVELEVPHVTVLTVPGALEIPIAAQKLAAHGCDAVVALGAIVKGDTDHYEIVVRESSAGISAVALATGTPIANAILAVHDIEEAVDRSGEGESNKGAEAVDAAVRTANALMALGEPGIADAR